MKSINSIISALFVTAICIVAGSCKKTAPSIFNMFDVQLELHHNSPYSVSQYQEVEQGDSLYFDFTITSPTKDMYQVALFQVGSALPFHRINLEESQRRTYTGVYKMAATMPDGESTFRIWAYDQQGIYLGDGYKSIVVNVKPTFTHLPNRDLYFPDSSGTSNCFLSLMTGTPYSFQTGSAQSGSIDLGIYRVPSDNGFSTYLYSPSADPLPFDVFDLSSWTKRGTLFANPQNNQTNTFTRTLVSGAAIEKFGKGRKPNSTAIATDLRINSMVGFLTPEGKYGAMIINAITEDYTGRPYMDVSIKYQN